MWGSTQVTAVIALHWLQSSDNIFYHLMSFFSTLLPFILMGDSQKLHWCNGVFTQWCDFVYDYWFVLQAEPLLLILTNLTFGKNRWYPPQSPSVFRFGLILLESLDGFPLTFFEVVSFPVVLMADISSINPKSHVSNNIVCVNYFELWSHLKQRPFGYCVMWIKGNQNSNSSSIPGDEYWYWCLIASMDLQQGCSPDSEVILLHNKSSVEVAPAR